MLAKKMKIGTVIVSILAGSLRNAVATDNDGDKGTTSEATKEIARATWHLLMNESAREVFLPALSKASHSAAHSVERKGAALLSARDTSKRICEQFLDDVSGRYFDKLRPTLETEEETFRFVSESVTKVLVDMPNELDFLLMDRARLQRDFHEEMSTSSKQPLLAGFGETSASSRAVVRTMGDSDSVPIGEDESRGEQGVSRSSTERSRKWEQTDEAPGGSVSALLLRRREEASEDPVDGGSGDRLDSRKFATAMRLLQRAGDVDDDVLNEKVLGKVAGYASVHCWRYRGLLTPHSEAERVFYQKVLSSGACLASESEDCLGSYLPDYLWRNRQLSVRVNNRGEVEIREDLDERRQNQPTSSDSFRFFAAVLRQARERLAHVAAARRNAPPPTRVWRSRGILLQHVPRTGGEQLEDEPTPSASPTTPMPNDRHQQTVNKAADTSASATTATGSSAQREENERELQLMERRGIMALNALRDLLNLRTEWLQAELERVPNAVISALTDRSSPRGGGDESGLPQSVFLAASDALDRVSVANPPRDLGLVALYLLDGAHEWVLSPGAEPRTSLRASRGKRVVLNDLYGPGAVRQIGRDGSGEVDPDAFEAESDGFGYYWDDRLFESRWWRGDGRGALEREVFPLFTWLATLPVVSATPDELAEAEVDLDAGLTVRNVGGPHHPLGRSLDEAQVAEEEQLQQRWRNGGEGGRSDSESRLPQLQRRLFGSRGRRQRYRLETAVRYWAKKRSHGLFRYVQQRGKMAYSFNFAASSRAEPPFGSSSARNAENGSAQQRHSQFAHREVRITCADVETVPTQNDVADEVGQDGMWFFGRIKYNVEKFDDAGGATPWTPPAQMVFGEAQVVGDTEAREEVRRDAEGARKIGVVFSVREAKDYFPRSTLFPDRGVLGQEASEEGPEQGRARRSYLRREYERILAAEEHDVESDTEDVLLKRILRRGALVARGGAIFAARGVAKIAPPRDHRAADSQLRFFPVWTPVGQPLNSVEPVEPPYLETFSGEYEAPLRVRQDFLEPGVVVWRRAYNSDRDGIPERVEQQQEPQGVEDEPQQHYHYPFVPPVQYPIMYHGQPFAMVFPAPTQPQGAAPVQQEHDQLNLNANGFMYYAQPVAVPAPVVPPDGPQYQPLPPAQLQQVAFPQYAQGRHLVAFPHQLQENELQPVNNPGFPYQVLYPPHVQPVILAAYQYAAAFHAQAGLPANEDRRQEEQVAAVVGAAGRGRALFLQPAAPAPREEDGEQGQRHFVEVDLGPNPFLHGVAADGFGAHGGPVLSTHNGEPERDFRDSARLELVDRGSFLDVDDYREMTGEIETRLEVRERVHPGLEPPTGDPDPEIEQLKEELSGGEETQRWYANSGHYSSHPVKTLHAKGIGGAWYQQTRDICFGLLFEVLDDELVPLLQELEEQDGGSEIFHKEAVAGLKKDMREYLDSLMGLCLDLNPGLVNEEENLETLLQNFRLPKDFVEWKLENWGIADAHRVHGDPAEKTDL